MSEKTVDIVNLYKKYPSSTTYAVDNISMFAEGGEIVGVLGQNGAGKTTALKCMTGMIPIDSGDILLCGHSIITEGKTAKATFGFVSDNHAVFDKMTGFEYINFMADIYRVPVAERTLRIEMFQNTLNLGDAIYNEISSYSHGMKQKIAIMGALIHSPKIWLLDEPMTGLDPQTTGEVKKLMFAHRDSGNTVLFSSHNLDAVEKLCDRVYVIMKGKLVGHVNMKEFRAKNRSLEEYFFELSNRSLNEKAAKSDAGAKQPKEQNK